MPFSFFGPSFWTTLLAAALFGQCLNAQDPGYTNRSVLADGDVYKLEIKETGIYQIDRDFLGDLGVNVANVDPRELKIYGNGGGKIPEDNGQPRFDDLVENAIVVMGEEDGSFDAGDRVVFFAEGPDVWKWDQGKWMWEENPFVNHNYYYLKISNGAGKRVVSNAIENVDQALSMILKCQHYEQDRVNVLGDFPLTEGTGQQWFGEYFNAQRTQSFGENFDMTGVVTDQPIEVEVAMAARSKSSSRVDLSVNGERFTRSVMSVSGSSTGLYARSVSFIESAPADDELALTISYPPNGTTSEAWLDAITIRSQHRIDWEDQAPPFFSDLQDDQSYGWESMPSANYSIWDVTDHHAVEVVERGFRSDRARQFMVWNRQAEYPAPVSKGLVVNQNLHAIDDVDMLVIYAKPFEEEVERYVEHRMIHSGLVVQAVTVQQIAEEFGSGKADPAAMRDFVRMVYEKSSQRLQYLLLFGDASYDYRHLITLHEDQNFVPTYQTKGALHPVSNFPSDDYFALLSDGEGASLVGALDIAVGRFPVKSLAEARSTVDKIIEYDNNHFGDWKLRHTWVADDEDSNIHFNQSERIEGRTDSKYRDFNSRKIYLDAYEQVSTPGGERYPEASAALDRSFSQGHLMVNYLGHGGPRGWAQERVLQLNDIQQWDNPGEYPLMITATCTFTGFDDPAVVSGGEASFLRDRSGVIALFTTTRAVYSNDNERLVTNVMDTLYSKVDGRAQRFGDVIRLSKNGSNRDTSLANARKFVLIGDPAQRLSLPQHDVAVTTINGTPIEDFTDTLGALQEVHVEAEVIDGVSGVLMSSFTGEASVTVFDKPSELRLLNNDPRSRPAEFSTLSNIIYRGTAAVTDGKLSFSFVVPADINYDIGEGKISIYAHNDVVDAAGHNSTIKIGGSGAGIDDDQGPTVQLYMNDRSFVDGGLTGANPTLIVDLADDLGINVTGSSIGHDLVATLEGPVSDSYVLNEFYQASTLGFQEGTATFPLRDLPPGDYVITVKAWDTANNSGEASLRFRVTDGEGLEITQLLNAPNPFADQTTILVQHNMIGYTVNLELVVYDMLGRVVLEDQKVDRFDSPNYQINLQADGLNPPGGNFDRTLIYPYTLIITIPELDNFQVSRSSQMMLVNYK